MKLRKSQLRQLIREEISKQMGNPLNENFSTMKDIERELEELGFGFDDGILGGVGSGGAGYYDWISDKISGYDLDQFNEEAFNEWYDNFTFEDFRSDEEEISIDTIEPGVYRIGEPGIGGQAIINNNSVTLIAIPTLSNPDGSKILPIFYINSNLEIIPEMDKETLKSYLSQNIENEGAWGVI